MVGTLFKLKNMLCVSFSFFTHVLDLRDVSMYTLRTLVLPVQTETETIRHKAGRKIEKEGEIERMFYRVSHRGKYLRTGE